MSTEDNNDFANHIVTEAINEGLAPDDLLDSTLTLLLSLLITARDRGSVDIKNVSISMGDDKLTLTLEKTGCCNESNK